jgi:hypothetical protein
MLVLLNVLNNKLCTVLVFNIAGSYCFPTQTYEDTYMEIEFVGVKILL